VQHRRSAAQRRRGFTFVELLIASVLLAVTAIGVAAAMAQTPQLTRSAREDVAIRMAMRACVAEISAAPFSEVESLYHGHAFDVPGIPPAHNDADGIPGVVRVEKVGDGASMYYVITLSVNWHGVVGDRVVSTVHYISNVRGDTDITGGGVDDTGSTDPNNANDGSGTGVDANGDGIIDGTTDLVDPITDPVLDPVDVVTEPQ